MLLINREITTLFDDPKKTSHLLGLDGAKERLHLFKENLLEEGSFDTAIQGCEGVFHTASPFYLDVKDPEAELLDPAVKGTLNVLNSCTKSASVRQVVLTSSIAAVANNGRPRTPDVVVDETWFSDPEICKEAKVCRCYYHSFKMKEGYESLLVIAQFLQYLKHSQFQSSG
ncbi:hypothetical protein I3843_14G118500 [Carya illinoinensis]|nr:hypothetical protein I3843_14G118500 [Carya illinoinensis]